MNREIFELKPEQQRAFNRLKKAYKNCIKSGVFFVNNYGTLQAYDSDLICGYGDTKMHAEGVSEVGVFEAGETSNSIKIVNEWTDDIHYFGLTKKGHKVYFES